MCPWGTTEKMGAWRQDPFHTWQRDLDGVWRHRRAARCQPSHLIWGPLHNHARLLSAYLKESCKWLASRSSREARITETFRDLLSRHVCQEWTPEKSLTIAEVHGGGYSWPQFVMFDNPHIFLSRLRHSGRTGWMMYSRRT